MCRINCLRAYLSLLKMNKTCNKCLYEFVNFIVACLCFQRHGRNGIVVQETHGFCTYENYLNVQLLNLLTNNIEGIK